MTRKETLSIVESSELACVDDGLRIATYRYYCVYQSNFQYSSLQEAFKKPLRVVQERELSSFDDEQGPFHPNGKLGTSHNRELEKAIATMAEVTVNYTETFRNDDDDDSSFNSGSINDIAVEPNIDEAIQNEHHPKPTESQAPYEDNPFFAPPSIDFYQTAAMNNPMDLLLDYGSDDDDTNDSARLISSLPSCPPVDLLLIGVPSIDSMDVDNSFFCPNTTSTMQNMFGKYHKLYNDRHDGKASHSSVAPRSQIDSQSTERPNVYSEGRNALNVARTAFITQESYGIPEFLAVIEKHTTNGSEERIQWTQHVDELGEALRENDTLPTAPMYQQEHRARPKPVSQRTQVIQQTARKKRQVPDHIMQFFDIEAEDDEDGEDSEGDPGNKGLEVLTSAHSS
ncbi:hypothetical protein EV361DRAFT_874442, partial [Lentinula raphanica]